MYVCIIDETKWEHVIEAKKESKNKRKKPKKTANHKTTHWEKCILIKRGGCGEYIYIYVFESIVIHQAKDVISVGFKFILATSSENVLIILIHWLWTTVFNRIFHLLFSECVCVFFFIFAVVLVAVVGFFASKLYTTFTCIVYAIRQFSVHWI